MKTYEDGLNEAWKLARLIVCTHEEGGKSAEWLEKIFGTERKDLVLKNFSASEAIDAMENYEKIKVGDEVIDKYGWKRVVVNTNQANGEITIMNCYGQILECCKKEVERGFKKTGRHFPQIEEVLKQMEEEEDE